MRVPRRHRAAFLTAEPAMRNGRSEQDGRRSAGLAATLALVPLGLYRRLISPLLPPLCRFYPSCSEYASQAIRRHGLVRGTWMAAVRLSKCHPLHPGGFDPVK